MIDPTYFAPQRQRSSLRRPTPRWDERATATLTAC